MYFCKYTGLTATTGIIILIITAVFSSPVYACQAADDIDGGELYDTAVNRIGEVVITALRHRFNVESSMPAQILAGRELEKLNSLSVADAVRYFSGVQLKDYGGVGGLKTVNVRSLGSAHTAVFYDGTSIGNAQNGQVDLGRYSLDNIETIELYNGQKPSIFQPARGFFASNTLFLRSKIPTFDNGKCFNLRASFKTGSFGLVDPAVLYQQKLSENLSLSASAELVAAHGRYKYRYRKDGGYDTTAVRQNGDIAAVRAEVTLHASLKNSGQASLKAYIYDSERGLPGAIVANRFSHEQRQRDRNFLVHGSLHKSLFANHNLLANLKFSSDYCRYLDPDYNTLDGALDNRYSQKEFYASLVNQFTLLKYWNVSLSTDFALNTLDANLYHFPYPVRRSFLAALSTAMKWTRFEVQANLLGGYIDESVKDYRPSESRQTLCPVISASVQPFGAKIFRLRAFYKESFRMPTFNDLYYTFTGNTMLRPEYTAQYDFGATWTLDRDAGFLHSVSAQADVYYNRVRDKIIAMPSSNLFRWTMMNLGEVEIKGMEANMNFGFRLPAEALFNLGLNYTFQQAIDITAPDETFYGHQIPYTPVHSGTLTASAGWKNLQLNYSFIYTGERYSQKANIPVNRVQPWYTSDMTLSWSGKLFKQSVRAAVEVNNVMNQYYDVILNFPMPGRNFRISVAMSVN